MLLTFLLPVLRSSSMLMAVASVQVLAIGAAWLLRSRDRLLRERLPYLTSVAVGVLLGTALLDLLPEAVTLLGNCTALWLTLGGTIVGLFAAERTIGAMSRGAVSSPDSAAFDELGNRGRSNRQVTRPINLLAASMLHSFVDGATVSAAFAAGERIGWLTACAVALHEIPHRVSDFALFLHLGLGGRQALRYTAIEGIPALAAAGLVLAVGAGGLRTVPWLLPVSAGSFLYIAMVDLLPEIGGESRLLPVLGQLAAMGVGLLLVAAIAGLPQG